MPACNLFEKGNSNEWKEGEFSKRREWDKTRKTVEAAKNKQDGLAARAKGRRGGDRANVTRATIDEALPSQSVQRRGYEFEPEARNPIMAGHMAPEEYRPGVKQVKAPAEKTQPKTHKVVNINKREGIFGHGGEGTFAVLGGSGTPDPEAPQSRRVFGELRGAETEYKAPKDLGRAKRDIKLQPTDTYRAKASNQAPVPQAPYREGYPQRFGATPARQTHSFAPLNRGPNCPGYVVTPPYSVGY